MADYKFVKAAPGARIRQPNKNSRVMPPEGDWVDMDDTYYSRMALTGDIVVVDPPTMDAGGPPAEQIEKPSTKKGGTK